MTYDALEEVILIRVRLTEMEEVRISLVSVII